MQSFELLLKNEKLKQYNQIAFFIILINLLTFLFITIIVTNSEIRITAIIAASLLLLALIIESIFKGIRKNEDSPYKFIAENIIALTWLQIGYWWLGAIFFIIGLLYFESKSKHIVSVLKKEIIYPSFPKKKIQWAELNNIMLKDGLLTIDFKNNKLIQQMIDENSSINQQEFNDFCKQQLKK